eukprot:CAMPEP_0119567192 /NCGR_PEP_ID=MMETSP1352-20130426/35256_1 /TAXON_ID=265584 /ORGANISM="Stauroneis constricta, Strain CCMP1120" /LENGTH=33 /DNA_ID= /DNA_START= /DNA_END= /DNA_ORIENTATION=
MTTMMKYAKMTTVPIKKTMPLLMMLSGTNRAGK